MCQRVASKPHRLAVKWTLSLQSFLQDTRCNFLNANFTLNSRVLQRKMQEIKRSNLRPFCTLGQRTLHNFVFEFPAISQTFYKREIQMWYRILRNWIIWDQCAFCKQMLILSWFSGRQLWPADQAAHCSSQLENRGAGLSWGSIAMWQWRMHR